MYKAYKETRKADKMNHELVVNQGWSHFYMESVDARYKTQTVVTTRKQMRKGVNKKSVTQEEISQEEVDNPWQVSLVIQEP